MLHPSYTDLMKVANSEVNEGETPVVNSRYSIVMATAKRARELIVEKIKTATTTTDQNTFCCLSCSQFVFFILSYCKMIRLVSFQLLK